VPFGIARHQERFASVHDGQLQREAVASDRIAEIGIAATMIFIAAEFSLPPILLS
jgi:hypothetical protein